MLHIKQSMIQKSNQEDNFTYIENKTKYLGTNATKEVKPDPQNEKCKTLWKEMEDDINKWGYSMFLDWKN